MNFVHKILTNKKLNKIAIRVENESITYSDLITKSEILAKYISENFDDAEIVCLQNEKSIKNIISILACIFSNKAFYIGSVNNLKTTRSKIKALDESACNYTESKMLNNKKINLLKLLYLIQTSGTTSRPKLIPITYYNFNAYYTNVLPYKIYEKNDFILHISDFSFDVAISDLLVSLAVGAEIYLLPTKDIYKAPFIIKNYKINTWSSTPYLAQSVLLKETKKYFKTIKKVIHCGEKFSIDLYNKWKIINKKIVLINLYGPAEATIAISVFKTKKLNSIMLTEDALPIGNFFKNIKTEINKNNELIISGPQVFGGYFNKSKLKKYNTNDIVVRKHSQFYFGGRTDSQVKIKGVRVQLEDLEFEIKKILKIQNLYINLSNETININILSKKKVFSKTNMKKISKILHNLNYKIIFLTKFSKTDSGKLKKTS